MISGKPMPYEELAMLWRLLAHERFCRNIPFAALQQHIANLNAIHKPPEPEQRALFLQEKLALRRELLETECEMKAQAAGWTSPLFMLASSRSRTTTWRAPRNTVS